MAIQEFCANHPDREAGFRCFQCSHYYCRECASSYQNRLVCSACLARLDAPAETSRRFRFPKVLAAAVAGGAALWIAYFGIGRLLVEIPSDFHDGVMWENLVD